MAPNLPSSSSDNNTNFTRKPLSPAALAMAAALVAGSPQVTAQSQDTYIDGVRATTAATKQRAADLCCEIGISQAEIDEGNRKAKGFFVKSSTLAGINDTPKDTIVNTPQASVDGASTVQQLANQEIQSVFGALSGIEYSKEFGPVINFGFQMTSSGDYAMVAVGKYSAKEKEGLLAYGVQINESQQLFFTGEHLQQQPSFGATGQSYTVGQNKAGLKFRYVPEAESIKNIELSGSYSQSADVAVGERYRIVNTALVFDQTLIEDGFVGAKQMEALISGTFDIGERGEIIIDGGATRMQYNDGTENGTKPAGGLKYMHYMGDSKAFIEARKTGDTTQTGIGYESNLGDNGNTWSLSATQMNGLNGWSNQIAGVNFNIPFGDKVKKTNYARPARTDIGDIGKNLVSYAKSEQSHKVLGKEVSIETHQAYFDKTTLTAGGDTFDLNPNGTIKNLYFDNGGFTIASKADITEINDPIYSDFFDVIGGKLAIINFKGLNKKMEENGIQKGDIKIFIVSVNDTSSNGKTVYTIKLRKNSVDVEEIDRAFSVTEAQRVALLAGTKTITQVNTENTLDTTPPVTSTAPSISTAATDTTVSVSQKINENGTGYYLILPATSAAPTVAAVLAGTAFTMTANTAAVVNITGLTANTAYKYYFVAKDSATTPNAQTTVSPGLSITTANAEIIPSTGAPTTSSITATGVTVANHITDADGVQNVNYFIYSDAAGTVQVATNTTGIFTGLSAYTTYYVKTTADTKNGTTGVYSTQTSSLTSFTTLDPVAASVPVINGVTNNSVYAATVNPNYTVPAGYTATATLNGNPFTNGASVGNGSYTLVVTFTKTSNNSQSSNTISFSVDTVSPSAPTITGVTNGSANNVTVVPTWGDPVGTTSTATLNGSAFTKGTAVPANGSYTLVVTSTKTNNSLTASTTTTWSIDKSLPTVDTLTLTGNAGAATGYTKTTAITISTSGSDNTGVTGWLTNEVASTPGASAVTASQPTSYTLSTGDATKTVYVWNKDAAGNVSLSRSATIVLDTAVPTKQNESLPLVASTTVSGSITMNENIQSITGLTIKESGPGTLLSTLNVGTSVTSISGAVVNLSIPVPASPGTGSVYIEMTGTDKAGNAFTIVSTDIGI